MAMSLHARPIRSSILALLTLVIGIAIASAAAIGASPLHQAAGLPAAVPLDQRDPVGSVGVYFDAAYTQTSTNVAAPFTPFTFYVVAKGLEQPGVLEGIGAYEFGLQAPAGVIVSGGRILPPGYSDFGAGDDNWIVGTGGCRSFLSNGGDTYLLVTYAGCLFLAAPGQNLQVRLTQATPPSFDPATPGFLSCEAGALFPFASSLHGRVNPLPCNLVAATFAGTVVTGRDGSGAPVFTYDAGRVVTGASVGDVNGDDEADLLLHTESNGAEPGSVVLLDCQGGVIWTFTRSSACQVTNGIVHVTSVEVGDFDTGSAGQEILVIAHATPTNDGPVTRVTLLNTDGTVHKANLGLAQEYWVQGDTRAHAVVDVAGVRSLILAGDNATYGAQPLAFALRVPLDNMRGQAPVRLAGAPCVQGTQVATALWDFVPNVSPPAANSYFQHEARITSLSIDGTVGTFTGQSGGVYELTLSDLQPLACELAQLSVGSVVTGQDAQGNPLWSFDPFSPIDFAAIVTLPAGDAVLVATAQGGSTPSSVLALDCHGKLMASFDGAAATCFGDIELPSRTVFLPEQPGPGGPYTGVFHSLYVYPSSGRTRIDRTDIGPNARSLAPDSHYDYPGDIFPITPLQAFDPPRPAFLMGARNDAAGGVVHVLAFDAASLTGAAPPVQSGCAAGSELWSSLFDGAASFPLEQGGVTNIERVDGSGFSGTLRVTVESGNSYLLDAATGALIPSCTLASVEAVGSTLRGLDGQNAELWVYDAGTPVLAAFLRDLDADGLPEAVGLAQTVAELPAHIFAVDCGGGEVYSTAVAALDCFGVTAALPTIAADLTAFEAGLLVLEDDGGQATQIVSVDLVTGDLLGTYAHRGTLAAVLLRTEGTPPAQVAAVGTHATLGVGVAFAIPFGYTGASVPGCALPPAKRFDTPWYVLFDGSSPDTPLEPALTGLAVDGDALNVVAQDGSSYLLNAGDGTPVPCELATVQVAGTEVVGQALGGGELWRVDLGSNVTVAELVDLGGTSASEVVVATDLGGSTPGQIVALNCGGEVYWTFDTAAPDCWTTSIPSAHSIPRLYAGVDLDDDGGTDILAITQVESGAAYRVVRLDVAGQVVGEYWHLGGFADAVLSDLGGDGVQDLVVLGSSQTVVGSGPADLLRLATNDLAGAAPPDAGTCAAGTEQWWLIWDDSIAGLPTELQPTAVVLVSPTLLEVQMSGGATYSITADGQPLTDVALALSIAGPAAPGDEVVVALSGSNLALVAGFDGTLSYDSALLQFVSAEAGDLLLQAGGFSTAFNGGVAGSIAFAAARATALGSAASSGELLRVRLRVAATAPTGVIPVTFAAIHVFDEGAAPLDATTQDGGVDVSCDKMDVSGDGTLHSNDAVLTLRISAELLVPDARQACAADADGDGLVDAGDAVLILRAIVGLPLLGPASGLASAADPQPAATTARVVLEGAAHREADGTVVVPLLVRGAGDIAGLDLTLTIDGEAALLQGASLVDVGGRPGDGFVVNRSAGRVLTVAAAASERLGSDGAARLWLRVQGLPADATSFTVNATRGTVFDVRAAKTTVEPAAMKVTLGAGEQPLVRRTELRQNQPNPFNPRTEIRFVLAQGGVVRLTVLDMAGRVVATLVDGPRDVGEHAVVWNGADDLGMPVASGVYLYRLEAGGGRQVRRMALVR